MEIITQEQFDDFTKEGSVLVKFFSKSCGNCKAQENILKAIKDEKADSRIAKIDTADAPGLVERFNLRTLPTMVVFKDGVQGDTLIGLKPKVLIMKALA